jgi:uncharacterized protein YybS (DUF2232 family)
LARSSIDATARDLIGFTAIITLCGIAATHIPVLGFACFFLLPLPVLYYRVRFGSQAASILMILSILIISAFSGGISADTILMAVMLGLGLLLGIYIAAHASPGKTIAYSTSAILAAVFLLLAVVGNLSGSGMFALVSEYIQNNLDLTVAAYRQMDGSEESIAMLDESIEKIHYVLVRIIPALSAVVLVITAWVNLLIGRTILAAAGFNSPVLGQLNLWQAPDILVWGVIGCGLLLLLPFHVPSVIALNLLIVMMLVYMLQGFAIMSFYFDKKRVPIFIRVLVYGTVAIQQFLLLFVVGLGFFDTWFNVRRINTGGNSPLQS